MNLRSTILPVLVLGAALVAPKTASADYWYHNHQYRDGWVHLDLRYRYHPHRTYYADRDSWWHHHRHERGDWR
jgi:hypothetical protein